MKKISFAVLAAAVAVFAAWGATALEKSLGQSDAVIHKFVGDSPSKVEVAEPYRKAISLHKLSKKELAYWNPHASKYIVDGKYAYLWCAIHKNNNPIPSHHWIAVAEESFDKAMDVGEQFAGGIAFYQLSYDGKNIIFKAFPYSTVNAMMKDATIVDIKE